MPASLSHVEISFIFYVLPYNIQRPSLKDCLWGFFFVNVILLQTSLWKCHPSTLFISSLALFSIIHHFPLEGSHTQGEALFELYVLKCDCETEGMAALDVLALGCYGLMLFAQPWSPVIEDFPPFPRLHCLQRSGGLCKLSIMFVEEESSCWGKRCSFNLKESFFIFLEVKVLKVILCVGLFQWTLDIWNLQTGKVLLWQLSDRMNGEVIIYRWIILFKIIPTWTGNVIK